MKTTGLWLLMGCVVAQWSLPVRGAELLVRAGRLRCEYLVNPLGIDTSRPRLSWIVESERRGQVQRAYQVLAASSEEVLARDQGDLWDSGKVLSSQTLLVAYGGKQLMSRQRCWWKVRVWDGDDEASGWSEAGWWSVGLLKEEDWQARWISSRGKMLRKGFEVSGAVRRATVYVCGVGQYELYLNGRKVGDRVMEPGWTNYRKTCLYSTYNVTGIVRRGGNAMGVMLGNGMYNVVGGRYAKFTGSFGAPKAIVQMEVEFEDGASQRIVSDESWKAADSPITFSCIYGGEDYDARKEQAGWDTAQFVEDGRWTVAEVVAGPGGVLRSQMMQPITVKKTIQPVAQRIIPGGCIYDLGQNFSGWMGVVVRGPAGSTLRFIPGERLKGDQADQSTSGGPTYFQYTLKGQGSETWSPRFSYSGFRYVRVEGAAPAGRGASPERPVIEKLEGQVLYPDVETAGEFACSNELFNRTHQIINWAIVSNMKSVLTDCPHREKLGWLEEVHLMGPSIMYNYDVPALYRKIGRDMAEAQLENGLVPDIAPEYPVFAGGFRDSPEWGSACVIAPWLVYRQYGDRRILEDNYEMMRRYVGYLGTQSKDSMVSHGLGDWYDIGPQQPGPSQNTPMAVTATILYCHDVRVLEQVATLLGKADEARGYAELGGQIRAAFNRQFFHADTSQYATGSQTANAMALVFGVVEADRRQGVLENLIKDIRQHGNHTTAGDVGHVFVLRALAEGGRSDVVFDMANSREHPSYGYQVEHGATSLTEAWDGPTRGASQNHFMLGHIEEWFYSELAGIRVDLAASGAERIVIRPSVVGDVTWARARHDSAMGRIVSDWKLEGGKLVLRVTIPANMTARVHVPATAPDAITESGKPANASEGVEFLRMDKGFALYEVGSGTYLFAAPFVRGN